MDIFYCLRNVFLADISSLSFSTLVSPYLTSHNYKEEPSSTSFEVEVEVEVEEESVYKNLTKSFIVSRSLQEEIIFRGPILGLIYVNKNYDLSSKQRAISALIVSGWAILGFGLSHMLMYSTYKKNNIPKPGLRAFTQSVCAGMSGFAYYSCVANYGITGFLISCLHHVGSNLLTVSLLKDQKK